jgi:hypothetical protein
LKDFTNKDISREYDLSGGEIERDGYNEKRRLY